jgi:hypothetical protein
MNTKSRLFTKKTLRERARVEDSLKFGLTAARGVEDTFLDIAKFSDKVLDTRLFDYQLEAAKAEVRFQCIVWGRQTGKSTVVAVKAIFFAMKGNKTILVLAPTQRQAGLLFQKIRQHISNNTLLMASVNRMTQTQVEFKNGSVIHSLPAGAGTGIRGFSADMIIIDECAFLRQDAVAAITPMLATKSKSGFQFVLMGTPFGKQGLLWQAFNNDEYFKSYHTSKENPLISEDFIAKEKERLTEIEFRQEYLAEFIESVNSFFPHELLFGSKEKGFPGCVQDYEIVKERRGQHSYYLGVDFARQGEDSSLFLVLEKGPGEVSRDNRLKLVWIEECQNMRLTHSAGQIVALNNYFQFEQIVLDETGLGSGPTDTLHEMKLGNVQSIVMGIQNKEVIYNNLRKMLEEGKLLLPNHRKLLYQMVNLLYEYRSTGHVSFHHSEEKVHDDYPDTLALAVSGFAKRQVYSDDFFIA